MYICPYVCIVILILQGLSSLYTENGSSLSMGQQLHWWKQSKIFYTFYCKFQHFVFFWSVTDAAFPRKFAVLQNRSDFDFMSHF